MDAGNVTPRISVQMDAGYKPPGFQCRRGDCSHAHAFMQGLEARLRSLAAFLSSSYRKGAKARTFAGSPQASQATAGGFGSMVGDGGDSVGGLPPAKRQRMEHVFRLEDQQCVP